VRVIGGKVGRHTGRGLFLWLSRGRFPAFVRPAAKTDTAGVSVWGDPGVHLVLMIVHCGPDVRSGRHREGHACPNQPGRLLASGASARNVPAAIPWIVLWRDKLVCAKMLSAGSSDFIGVFP